MAFNVTALTEYVNEHRSELMAAAVIAFRSSTLFELMPEVKGKTALNLLSAPVTFQNGDSCGFNASGNVTFTQRMIDPGVIKVNESYCPKTLRKYYMQNEVKLGAGRETMPFEEKIMSLIIANIGAEMEKAFWQGNKTSGTGNLAFFDGLHTILAADVANSVIASSAVHQASASDTVYDRVKTLAEVVPDAVGNRMKFYMSTSNYRKLAMLIVNKNLFHYERNVDSDDMRMIFPGTDLEVIGVAGLAGVNNIYGLIPEEVAYGFDSENDVESFDLWYSKDNDEFRFKCQWAAGVQYAFPQDVLVGTPA